MDDPKGTDALHKEDEKTLQPREPINGENRLQVTDELVDVDKQLVEVQVHPKSSPLLSLPRTSLS